MTRAHRDGRAESAAGADGQAARAGDSHRAAGEGEAAVVDQCAGVERRAVDRELMAGVDGRRAAHGEGAIRQKGQTAAEELVIAHRQVARQVQRAGEEGQRSPLQHEAPIGVKGSPVEVDLAVEPEIDRARGYDCGALNTERAAAGTISDVQPPREAGGRAVADCRASRTAVGTDDALTGGIGRQGGARAVHHDGARAAVTHVQETGGGHRAPAGDVELCTIEDKQIGIAAARIVQLRPRSAEVDDRVGRREEVSGQIQLPAGLDGQDV